MTVILNGVDGSVLASLRMLHFSKHWRSEEVSHADRWREFCERSSLRGRDPWLTRELVGQYEIPHLLPPLE